MRREVVCWRISLVVAVLSLAAAVYELWWDKGLLGVLLMVPVAVLVSLTLLVLAFVSGKRFAVHSLMLLLLLSASCYGVFRFRAAGNFVRFELRWKTHRSRLQHEVMSNPDSEPGLKHMAWDDWGMAGQATLSYLVYDPKDQLQNAARTQGGRLSSGLPQEVWQVWRLEPQWYSVVFYTNSCWDCPPE